MISFPTALPGPPSANAGYGNHVLVKPAQNLSGLGSTGTAATTYCTGCFACSTRTFMAMKNSVGGKDLRIGGQNGVLMWNRESDDATVPSMSPAGNAQSRALPTQQRPTSTSSG